jgi:hypothetical protein
MKKPASGEVGEGEQAHGKIEGGDAVIFPQPEDRDHEENIKRLETVGGMNAVKGRPLALRQVAGDGQGIERVIRERPAIDLILQRLHDDRQTEARAGQQNEQRPETPADKPASLRLSGSSGGPHPGFSALPHTLPRPQA